jgi:hypothetical protein
MIHTTHVLHNTYSAACHIPPCAMKQEGVGHAVMSAYVEVVFDNSDSRLPVSKFAVQSMEVS